MITSPGKRNVSSTITLRPTADVYAFCLMSIPAAVSVSVSVCYYAAFILSACLSLCVSACLSVCACVLLCYVHVKCGRMVSTVMFMIY